MALENAQTFTCTPIPDPNRAVHSASEEEALIELESPDRSGVAPEHAETVTSIQIPDSDCLIVRASNKDGVRGGGEGSVILKTHDTVFVALTISEMLHTLSLPSVSSSYTCPSSNSARQPASRSRLISTAGSSAPPYSTTHSR